MKFKNLFEVREFINELIKQYIYDFKFERIFKCIIKQEI